MRQQVSSNAVHLTCKATDSRTACIEGSSQHSPHGAAICLRLSVHVARWLGLPSQKDLCTTAARQNLVCQKLPDLSQLSNGHVETCSCLVVVSVTGGHGSCEGGYWQIRSSVGKQITGRQLWQSCSLKLLMEDL